MSVTQLISDYSDTTDSCWFVAGNAHNRNAPFDSQSIATSILAPSMQIVTSPPHPHRRVATNQLPFPLRTELYRSHATAKSP